MKIPFRCFVICLLGAWAGMSVSCLAGLPEGRDVGYLDLPPEDATLHGDGARKDGAYMTKIKDWQDPETWMSWEITTSAGGEVRVQVTYACAGDSAGSEVECGIGDTVVAGKTVSSGEWSKFRTDEWGILKIPGPGTHTVHLRARSKPGAAVLDLDKVTLVAPFMRQASRKAYAFDVAPRTGAVTWPNDEGVAHNTLSAAEKAEGFRLLFDGKTTTGWTGYRKDHPPSKWQVVDGLLHYPGGDAPGEGGDLMFAQPFSDFELKLEWKISPKGNSGVIFHVAEDKHFPFETGIEMQILDNGGHGDGKNILTSSGACYGMYPTVPEAVKPVGEWNEAVIRVRGPKHEFFLNGVKTASFDTSSEDWGDRLRQTKFHRWADFATHHKGYLCLQDHGDPVWYRNLRIRER